MELEERCIAKIVVEVSVNKDEVSMSGGLDPGEGGYQIGTEDWMGANALWGS